MNELDWHCNAFQQLSNSLLYDIIKLRIDTFVVEQQCPYPELDNKDENIGSRHITAHMHSKLIAYARILPPGLSYPEVSIGRFIVEPSFRRQGIGSELITKCLEEIINLWPDQPIKISAQEHIKKFYENFGFTQISDNYLEDGIPHVAMLKES
ncbi:MAG: GNAT family N-acetyltransferase [Gammaproteobacteria bacterium]